jgi:uncharacterized protein
MNLEDFRRPVPYYSLPDICRADDNDLRDYCRRLEPILWQMFGTDQTGHDMGHIARVFDLALRLQEIEGGERRVIGISALLHDSHRYHEQFVFRFNGSAAQTLVSARESLIGIAGIMETHDLPSELIVPVCNTIAYHDFGFNVTGLPIEAKVIKDADTLESLGAIGVARLKKWNLYYGLTRKDALCYLENTFTHLPEAMQTTTGREWASESLVHTRNYYYELKGR